MVTRDLADYVSYRLNQSPTIQANVTASVSGANQARFASHLLALSRGSFLFAKLTLDLIESGHLVAKSASYKVSRRDFKKLVNNTLYFIDSFNNNLYLSLVL